jgi:hypothetical protein
MHKSFDEVEGDTRHEVEEDDAGLVKSDPGDVEHVELLGRDPKPLAPET